MTTKTLKAAADMWNRGIPPKEIARTFGMNEWTLWTHIRRHRDLFPYRRHHEEWWRERLAEVDGMSSRDAARRLGCSYETVCRWRRMTGC